MFETWAQGGVTVEQAAEKILEAVLQGIAGAAWAQGTQEMAKGFAALSPMSPDFGSAPSHFTSAALWFSLGAALDIGSGLLANATSKSSSAGTSSSSGTSTSNAVSSTAPTAVSVQQPNVPRFGAGALVTQPMIAQIGESMLSANQAATEAVIPLDNPMAMQRLRAGLGAAGGETHYHSHFYVTVNGLVSDDVLSGVMRKMSAKVRKNQGRLDSSNTYRVTKRSV